jgi:hypothetical protein
MLLKKPNFKNYHENETSKKLFFQKSHRVSNLFLCDGTEIVALFQRRDVQSVTTFCKHL